MPPKRTFESLYAELEETTRKLEHGNLPLDESLKLYEKGAGLVEELRTILDEAELHVETLRVRLRPSFEPGPSERAPAAAQFFDADDMPEPVEFEDDYEDD